MLRTVQQPRGTKTAPYPRIPVTTLLVVFVLTAFSAVWAGKETMLVHLADGFDYPVGKPDADGYFVYRGYWPGGHHGEDWNGRGGGNSDKGDPVYSIGRGVVVQSYDVKQGWGNVAIIRHAYRDADGSVKLVDSLYGHLDVRQCELGDIVERGQQIGTIGCGPNNMYLAHLHFEIRKNLNIGMNRSKFKNDYSNYHSPRRFLDTHRTLNAGFRKHPTPINTFQAYDSKAAIVSNLPAVKTGSRVSIPTLEDADKLKDELNDLENKVRKIIEKNTPVGDSDELDNLWDKLKSRLSSSKTDGDEKVEDKKAEVDAKPSEAVTPKK